MSEEAATSLFGTLANGIRLNIVLALRKGEMNVSQLVEELGLKQSTVSHNLKRLARQKLVQSRSEGPFRYFSLNAASMEPVLQLIEKQSRSTGKRIRLAMDESADRLTAVLDSAPIILFTLDDRGIITMIKGKGLAELGIKPQAMIGQPLFSLGRDLPNMQEHARLALSGKETTAIVQVKGQAIETRFSPVKDDKGAIVGVVAAGLNVTDSTYAARALKEAEEKIRQLETMLRALDRR